MKEQGEIWHEDEENHLPPPRGLPQEGLGQAAANAQLGKQEKARKTQKMSLYGTGWGGDDPIVILATSGSIW